MHLLHILVADYDYEMMMLRIWVDDVNVVKIAENNGYGRWWLPADSLGALCACSTPFRLMFISIEINNGCVCICCCFSALHHPPDLCSYVFVCFYLLHNQLPYRETNRVKVEVISAK